MPAAPVEVALVNMPFGPAFRPSLALAQLAALLRARGVSVRVMDFTIRLAEWIGHDVYAHFSNQRPLPADRVGDWIFAGALFEAADPAREEKYLDGILRRHHPYYGTSVGASEKRVTSDVFIENVRVLRGAASRFVDQCLTELLATEPRLVGFTSVFQQHVASLALAKRLRAARPEVAIVFGGPNCEGPMGVETARQFPFIDAVVSGEGDVVFPEIVRRVLAGEALRELQGVFLGGDDSPTGQTTPSSASPAPNLDALPLPDFSDYFTSLAASRLDKHIQPLLLYETSRGCWWGQKSHCTFCGLNTNSMAFRSKSAERALADLQSLAARHPGASLNVVDNILDMRYFRDLLPRLADLDLGLQFFWEVKANLRKDHVRLLRAAGITSIQPGIESFATSVLTLMGKGVRGIHNVQLLKWCRELGVKPYWNVLWGFPGEDPAEYERMADLVPLLVHFEPPQSTGRIRLDRFSPNFERAEHMGFENVRPHPATCSVYDGLPDEAVRNLSYYFAFDYREPRDPTAYTARLNAAIEAWRDGHSEAGLFFEDDGTTLAVWDLRPIAVDPLTLVDGLDRAVLQAADSTVSIARLTEIVSRASGRQVTGEEVAHSIDRLVERGLVVVEDDLVLALPIALGVYQPEAPVRRRWASVASRLAAPSRPTQ